MLSKIEARKMSEREIKRTALLACVIWDTDILPYLQLKYGENFAVDHKQREIAEEVLSIFLAHMSIIGYMYDRTKMAVEYAKKHHISI